MNKSSVKVTKSQKRLNIFDFLGFQPVKNCFDFILRHAESVGRKDESKVFNCVFMELTFARCSIESISSESPKDFLDVSLVLGHVVRVYEDIVEVYNYTNIQHIAEDVIHKSLKGGGSIGKSEWHYQPFKGAIASAKGGFPFIAICYVNQMVGMA